MKKDALCYGWGALFVGVLLLYFAAAGEAHGGETSVYLKSGWFRWDETYRGRSFVSEEGFMHGAGITRKEKIAPVSFAALLEVWGGNPDYAGHDLTNSAEMNTDTIYLGTKTELSVGVPLQSLERLVVEPFAGVGHRFWIRTRSSEDWNTLYGKIGGGAEWRGEGFTLFLKAGGILPLYTRTHVSLKEAGYPDIAIEPKSSPSAFAECGVGIGALTLAVEYEGMAFDQSEKVTVSRPASTVGGVAVVNSEAFQPDSEASLVSLKVTYAF